MNIVNCTVTIHVTDINKAIQFYTEVVGFELIINYGQYYAELQAPGLFIGLHTSDKKVQVGNNMSIGIAVRNINYCVEKLKENGIEIDAVEDGPITIASFSDPDGNGFYLTNMNSKPKRL